MTTILIAGAILFVLLLVSYITTIIAMASYPLKGRYRFWSMRKAPDGKKDAIILLNMKTGTLEAYIGNALEWYNWRTGIRATGRLASMLDAIWVREIERSLTEMQRMGRRLAISESMLDRMTDGPLSELPVTTV